VYDPSAATSQPVSDQRQSAAQPAASDPPASDEERARALRLNRRDTLLDMVRAVYATNVPDSVAREIVERASAWIPLDCWAVVGVDEQMQPIVLAERGLSPDVGPALHVIAEWVIGQREGHPPGLTGVTVAFPLRGHEQVIAVLVGMCLGASSDRPAPGRALISAAEALLTPAGYALDAALLLKRTEALSVTDDLTRLYNARYLNVALRRETRLATRNNRPLSLLFIDLDGFKSINDSHGHLAGSRALVEAGAVIRGSARETDIVARFGGDEFALILPDTGSAGALAVAERIRDRIARHSFLAGDGLHIHLTASVGVATLPEAAVAADELVQAADAAMYRVKDRGKNGIQAAASSR
jgi:diguanylate cyclase (GGDEF)-like protein